MKTQNWLSSFWMVGVVAMSGPMGQSAYAQSARWNGRIFEVKTRTEMSREQYIHNLASFPIIVLGEEHYVTAVQAEQASTIREVVLETGKTGAFTTAWEFLNFTAQEQTTQLFEQVRSGQMTVEQFLKTTQGAAPNLMSYAPVIKNTADLGGRLLGVNLSREEKAPVVKGGLSALEPRLLPPHFEYGSATYAERFEKFMLDQGHAKPEQIPNYYAAQCLVDDVVAYHLLGDSGETLKFLIEGGFHTDYLDGTVSRILKRAPRLRVVSVRIVDASFYSENELLPLLHSEKYGDLADFVVFVNEPEAPQP